MVDSDREIDEDSQLRDGGIGIGYQSEIQYRSENSDRIVDKYRHALRIAEGMLEWLVTRDGDGRAISMREEFLGLPKKLRNAITSYVLHQSASGSAVRISLSPETVPRRQTVENGSGGGEE